MRNEFLTGSIKSLIHKLLTKERTKRIHLHELLRRYFQAVSFNLDDKENLSLLLEKCVPQEERINQRSSINLYEITNAQHLPQIGQISGYVKKSIKMKPAQIKISKIAVLKQ